jgi:hypothetical protein
MLVYFLEQVKLLHDVKHLIRMYNIFLILVFMQLNVKCRCEAVKRATLQCNVRDKISFGGLNLCLKQLTIGASSVRVIATKAFEGCRAVHSRCPAATFEVNILQLLLSTEP